MPLVENPQVWRDHHLVDCIGYSEGQACCADMVMPSGVYRHFKGKHYLLIGVGRLDDAITEHGVDATVVVYVPLYEAPGPRLAIRPLADWVAQVEWPDGQQRSRFEYVGESING